MQLYLLSVHHPEDAASKPPPEVLDRIDRELAAFHEELRATGAWVFAGGLHPSTTAAVVRADGDGGVVDGVVMTDGPYAETKEQLGGICIVRAADRDAALALGARASAATGLAVEVRAFAHGEVD
jgi:hypothetical protein